MATGTISDLVQTWPVQAAAVAVVGPGGVLARHGDDDVSFAWASVTKIVAALTALDACADGTVSLDDPAGPPGSTLRHLLSHTSGLPFDGDMRVSAPGRKRIYSNTGVEVMADHVAARAGGPFADELAGRVLGPLRMTGTVLDGSPAHAASGPLRDLVALARELLTGRVLGSEIIAQASTVAFPGLSGVLPGFGRQATNDWGLGCEIRDHKTPHWTSTDNSPRTFGHFGQSGSFVWVDPEVELACVCLCDRSFGPWAAKAWPVLATAVIADFAGG